MTTANPEDKGDGCGVIVFLLLATLLGIIVLVVTIAAALGIGWRVLDWFIG
jgi:hypothetical protein